MTNINSDIVALSIKDFLTKKVLTIATLPLLFAVVMLIIFFIFFSSSAIAMLQGYFNLDGGGWLSMLLSSSIAQSISHFVFYIFGSAIVLLVSVVLGLIIIGFLTPYIVKIIQTRHYPEFELKEHGTLMDTLFFFVKTFAIFFMILFLLTPLYFIPAINLIAINIPFFYLFHHLILRDILTAINSKKESKVIQKANKMKLYSTSAMLYAISLIPFVGVFLQALFVILYSHFIIRETIELRKVRTY